MRTPVKQFHSLFAALVVGGAVFAADADWPQFRGPTRDNKVSGFRTPATWPKTLKQGWKVTVGDAVASPVLAGETLYVFTRQGKDEVLTALDAATGKKNWEYRYEAEELRGPASSFRGPRSTPAVGDGKVATLGVGGVVSCVDAKTGKEVWQKKTNAKPQFYTSDSPLVAEGLCVIHLGDRQKGELTAFDLGSGEVKWKWAGDAPSYGSPVLATISGVKQVVVVTPKNLVGVSFSDGKLLWQTPFMAGRYPTGTPVVDGDTVIVPGRAFAIVHTGDKFESKELWKGQAPHQYNTPVLKDGVLYGLSGRGKSTKLYAQDAKTGKVLWEGKDEHGECGAVLDAGSVLLEQSSDSQLVAFKPSKTGYEEIAKYKVADSPTWAMPIVAGNRIYVKDRESVTLWTIE